MDKISKEARSKNMSLIRSKDTKPELSVRKYFFAHGLRYRLHSKLPGKPDLIFPSKKIAIFIHGCFWHGHGCKNDHTPKSNTTFWQSKIAANKQRDDKVTTELLIQGWQTYTIWECMISDSLQDLCDRIKQTSRKHP